MLVKVLSVLLVFSVSVTTVSGQDNIRIMQYNLLQYGTTCNTVAIKNGYLKTIVKYVQPDILGLNELGPSDTYAVGILNNVMNTDGVTYYRKAAYTNVNGSSNLSNMLFYNSNKLTLKSQYVSNTVLRDINHYRLYYNDPHLGTTHDTTFITVIIVHLKAGSTIADADQRAVMTANVMSYLHQHVGKKDNYVIMGDFNTKTNAEECYQNLVNPSQTYLRFNDPIHQEGSWYNNSSYINIHTQSTRTTDLGDCGDTGGFDDRFDMILLSDSLLNSSSRLSYKISSYKAVGQDGTRFNKSMVVPTNYSYSSAMVDALYNMSDHLPVILDLNVTSLITGIATYNASNVNQCIQEFSSGSPSGISNVSGTLTLTICNSIGENIYQGILQEEEIISLMNINPDGVYLITIQDEQNKICRLRYVNTK